jgi:formate dehydrogenase gamma subunit
MLPTWQDVRDAWQMVKYMLFISKNKPVAGKYNFEEKFTYWFIFVAVGIMVITGLIIWFPIAVTRVLPGAAVPASKLAHSTEAVVAAVFVIVWHFFHVLLQRLNLSMFTGRISDEEMRTYHTREYERLTGEKVGETKPGGSQ